MSNIKASNPFKAPQFFIFIGRSGCGKGTQAKLLEDYLKKVDPKRTILYVQTGQKLREFIQGDTLTQKLAKKAYEEDVLQPEFVALYQWIKIVVDGYSANEHLIFDGTPRRVHEAGVVSSLLGFYGLSNPWVIHIDISREEAARRLSLRKRMDDKKDDVEKRLNWYETEVVPTIEYFKRDPRYRYIALNGERPVEEVHKDIISLFDFKELPI